MFDQPEVMPQFARNPREWQEVMQLEQTLQEDKDRGQHLQRELQLLKARKEARDQHKRELNDQRRSMQALLHAKREELQNNDNEEIMLKTDIDRLQKKVDTNIRLEAQYRERRKQDEATVEAQKQSIDMIRKEMSETADEIKQKFDATAFDQEALNLVEKYTHEDEARIVRLRIVMRKLLDDYQTVQHDLERTTTDIENYTVEESRLRSDLKQSTSDYQEQLQSWIDTLDQVSRRDAEINALYEQLMQKRADYDAMQVALRQENTQLDNDLRNKADATASLEQTERRLAKAYERYQQVVDEFKQFMGKFEALKYRYRGSNVDLKQKRMEMRSMRNYNHQLQEQTAQTLEEVASLQKAYENIHVKNAKTDDIIKEYEAVLKEQDNIRRRMNLQIKKLRTVRISRVGGVQRIKKHLDDEETKFRGNLSTIDKMKVYKESLEREMRQQETLLYDQAFKIEQIRRRILKMQGHTTNKEKAEQQERMITTLSQQLEANQTSLSDIRAKVRSQQESQNVLKDQIERTRKTVMLLDAKLGELNLHLETAERELTTRKKDLETLAAEEGIARLKMKYLQDLLDKKEVDKLDLEKRACSLLAFYKERKAEISIQEQLMRTRVKHAEESRCNLKRELSEVFAQVVRAKHRFSALLLRGMTSDDANGGSGDGGGNSGGAEEKSQAYYIIQAAQAKEELQRERANLQSQITKKENENHDLIQILDWFVGGNSKRRNDLKVLDERDELYVNAQNLEEQLIALKENIRRKQRDAELLKNDIQQVKNKLQQRLAERDHNDQAEVALHKRVENIGNELDELDKKIKRELQICAQRENDLRALLTEDDFNDLRAQLDYYGTLQEKRLRLGQLRKLAAQNTQDGADAAIRQLCIDHGVKASFSAIITNNTTPSNSTTQLSTTNSRQSLATTTAEKQQITPPTVISKSVSPAAPVNNNIPRAPSPAPVQTNRAVSPAPVVKDAPVNNAAAQLDEMFRRITAGTTYEPDTLVMNVDAPGVVSNNDSQTDFGFVATEENVDEQEQ